MSIKLMQLVWDADVPQSRKMVLLSLADQANDAGECYPRISTIERRCSMGRRTVFQCLADLETEGFLTRTEMSGQRVLFRIDERLLRQLSLDVSGIEQNRAQAAESFKAAQARRASTAVATGAKSAPVQKQHQCENGTGADSAPVQQPHLTGADLAPDRCEIGTPIKQPPLNPKEPTHTACAEAAGEGAQVNPDDRPLTKLELQRVEPYLEHCPPGVKPAVLLDFVDHRAASRRALSIQGWAQIRQQLQQLATAGVDLNAALKEAMAAGLSLPVAPRAQRQRGGQRAKANDDFSQVNYGDGTPDDQLPAHLRQSGEAAADAA